MTILRSMTLLALSVSLTPVFAADPNAGKTLFRQQCALCHSAEPNDNGGAQGPNLNGVFERHAAANASFSYTKALQASNLTWDQPTLDRFLSSPTTVVPGTAMVIAVSKDTDRQNVIAYFQAVKEGTFKDAAAKPFTMPPMPPGKAGPPAGTADWKNDKPGRMHRIDVAKLPAPFASNSVANFPKLVPKPDGAKLSVPDGFKVDVFATTLDGPRAMRVAPNGDIFVTENRNGKVKVMRPSADGATAASVETFAQGLSLPFGLAFYPSGDHPQWLYVAETNRVVRYAYKVGDQKASGVPEIVVPELSPSAGGGHFTRDIAFSPDGRRGKRSAPSAPPGAGKRTARTSWFSPSARTALERFSPPASAIASA
jgi:cytochrome c2